MFKKLNLKVLLIIFVVLVAWLVYSEYKGDKSRSFARILVAVDTARVTQIHIQIPMEDTDIVLSRTGEFDWQVSADGNNYIADRNVVRSILNQFHEIKPQSIAAASTDKWEEYEVSESTGIKVSLKSGNRNLAEVVFGKFSYAQPPQQADPRMQMQQQQQGSMTSFIRKSGEDRVYAVEGFLRMTYQKDVNAYRDKRLVNVRKDDISRLVFNHPDFQFTVEKTDNRWMLNDQPADSLKTERYLSRLSRLTSSNFIPLTTPKTGDATHRLRIEGNNFSPIELKAFPTSDTLINYVVTSNLNPQAEFNGDKVQLFERTFLDETGFLPDPE